MSPRARAEPGPQARPMNLIRNFSIIAHVDHGKSTLADRFIQLCGGLEEVVRGFDRRHRDLDRERLLRYTLQFDGPVAAKRLGLLLELVGHGDVRLFRELERTIPRLGYYALLDPGAETQAMERNRRWELDVNGDVDKLLHGLRT